MTEALNLLPIGTVVTLHKNPKKLMIIGIKQLDKETQETSDYIAVLYPEGFITRDILFKFNHEDIMDIIYKGYENSEQEEFLKKVNKILSEK